MRTYAPNDIHILLQQVFSGDSIMLSYCPGGYYSTDPPQEATFPCIRAWQQSPGSDVLTQGTLGPLMSSPKFMIGVMDYNDQCDWYDGTSGISAGFDLATRRIHDLLHGITFFINGLEYLATAKSAGPQQPNPVLQGKYRPWQGWFFEFNVQQAN